MTNDTRAARRRVKRERKMMRVTGLLKALVQAAALFVTTMWVVLLTSWALGNVGPVFDIGVWP